MFRYAPPSSLLWMISLALTMLVSCQQTSELPAALPTETEPQAAKPETTPAETESQDVPSVSEPVPDDPTPVPLPELSFAFQTMDQIPAQDEAVTAENGVMVQIASESLAEGVEAQLSLWEIDASWRQALEQTYTIETPFVSLAATGVNDGQGRATLRLPAANPGSRLATVIDNTYIALLDVPPSDGYLETAVRLGPKETGDVQQVGSLAPGGSLQLSVLTPKTNSAALNTTTTVLIKYHLDQQSSQDGRSCGIDLDTNFGRITHCRKSADGTVQVNFLWGIDFSDAEGDQLANVVAGAMARYGELGFTAAKLTPRSPMQIVVETRSGDPTYRSMNGVIYLPVDAAKDMIAGTAYDALHEMAHWIEDEEYNMAWAYWSGGKTWWLETAAENMVMLHDPAYIPQNLITYSPITTGDGRLALQQSPYQWPGDYYVHAQLVKVNMCPDTAVCPLSESSFITAINQGTYPFDSADAQSKVSANLDAYAQYLLGTTPASGNTAMPLDGPIASGDFGEYVEVAQTNKSDIEFFKNGVEPQMQVGNDTRGKTITIAATLQKDGVYPLSVSSGVGGLHPSLPVALTIQPGAPFWYRIGEDAPQFHDGAEELVLQPIHLTMGLPGVRLVALGKAGGETFQATISQIDLQGTWLVVPGEAISGKIVCQQEQNDSGVSTSVEDPDSVIEMSSKAILLGDMMPDSAGNGLTWEWNMDRLPADAAPFIGTLLKFDGAALPNADKIQVQTAFELQRFSSQASAQPQLPPLSLGLVAIVPGALVWRQRQKRPYLTFISLFLVMLLLAGCFGIGAEFWGTVTADMQFTELEYLGSEAIPVVDVDVPPEESPLWKLRGTADYTVDTHFAAVEEGETAAATHCEGTATYKVEARIFKDIAVNLE